MRELSLRASSPEKADLSYSAWTKRFDTVGPRERVVIRRGLRSLRRHPLISVILPVYNPDLGFLEGAIQSVRNQLYENWELCIADDASSDPAPADFLRETAESDSRIKIILREGNGHIAACSNSALALASGEWIALLDHDDLLPEHALAFVAAVINRCPEAGLIYSDEDKIDERGERCRPFFKPDFNPELLLGQNCIVHLGVYRHSLVREIGGFREGFEGSQDYDLTLRCVEKLCPEQVVHIPRVLYHWRMSGTSVAQDPSAKPYAPEAARRAVKDFLERKKISAQIVPAPQNPVWQRVVYDLPEPAPLASVIIPTRDQLELLCKCVSSVEQLSDYSALEIIIVDNDSAAPATQEYLESLSGDPKKRVVKVAGDFNFSRLVNAGALEARGEILVLLNNDIEVTEAGWLREMVSQAMRPEVGGVGARLWLPDGRLQHAGVITGVAGIATHAFYRFPPDPIAQLNRNFVLAQNFSAVTAACMVLRKAVFERVNGFDERLPANFNDVDFCLRLRERGFQIVWTPFANLLHRESSTRGFGTLANNKDIQREIEWMIARWGDRLLRDPFYSPNLTATLPGFELAFPPRLPPLDADWSDA